ncbi:MAG: MEMO1 family protein [Thaumarchaeota archaeon]|nr:MEMO1 family protein [Nitrososphaerota archaeon]MCL5318441.1 MEMO1 family protein [Nitrososphaerota archaeon]
MKIRRPAAAGQFYPLSMTDLHDALEGCFKHPLGPGSLPPSPERMDYFGAVVPHAGYTYSGPIAAHAYYALSGMRKPDLVVILGPNHWGIGSSVSVYPEGAWDTPLGRVEIDSSAAKYLAEVSNIADLDASAHKRDHCIEVQLPFLQYIYGRDFKILPIILVLQDFTTATELGRALASLTKRQSTLLIASSDFTHYELHRDALDKDSRLIDTILSLDIPKFYRILEQLNISACGYGAIAAVMAATKELGATDGRLLKYGTSGDITGDYSSVVGYSSIVFE